MENHIEIKETFLRISLIALIMSTLKRILFTIIGLTVIIIIAILLINLFIIGIVILAILIIIGLIIRFFRSLKSKKPEKPNYIDVEYKIKEQKIPPKED